MEKELTEFEIRKRLRIIFSVAFTFTFLLVVLVLVVGFAHSWEMNGVFGLLLLQFGLLFRYGCQ